MDIASQVRQIIADRLGVDVSKVVDSARFTDDLGADSLDSVEMVMEIEKRFHCEITDEMAHKFKTVKSVVDFVEQLTAQQ